MSAPEKLLTIVVPVFNRGHLLERTLDSIALQRQALGRVRLVVVDNASSDNSRNVAERWCARHPEIDASVTDCKVPGAAAARNEGLRRVDTPYVMFFDSDDEMLPGHLEMVIDGIENHPGAQLLGWEVELERADGTRRLGRFTDRDALVTHLIHASMATQRYVVATELLRGVGGWDERMRGWDDYELGVRLLLGCDEPVWLNHGCQPTVQVNFTEDSITGRFFSADPAKWELPLQAIEAQLQRKLPDMLGWVVYRRAVLAAEYAREGSKADSRRLMAQASLGGLRNALVARMVYCIHRVIGRGSHFAAAAFLPRH